LFENFDDFLIGEIKTIYEKKYKGLFLLNLKKYLSSDLPKLNKLIKFIDKFDQNT
jgi:hypothetical protein